MTGLDDLTLPKVDSTTLHTLYGRYLRRQSKLFNKIPWSKLLHLQAEDVDKLSRLIRVIQEEEAGLYFSLLRLPSIGGYLRCVEGALRDGNQPLAVQLSTEMWAQILVELESAGRVEEDIRLKMGRNNILCSSGGWFDYAPNGYDSIQASSQGLSYLAESKPPVSVTKSVACELSIRDAISLCLFDTNPLAFNEAHPDKSGNELDLGSAKAEQWRDSLHDALVLIEQCLPELYAEMKTVMRTIVPVGVDANCHVSASYQEVIGCLYLSLHPNVVTMAEALIHEFSHTKLNILSTFDPILANAFTAHLPSPFRPDLRPLHGILLGVHAFLPVECFMKKLTEHSHPQSVDPGFQRRRVELREKNRAACETLVLHGEPSQLGSGLLDEIVRINRDLSSAGLTRASSGSRG